jgi:hypothetical protein
LETKEDKRKTCRGREHSRRNLRSVSRQMFISNLSNKSCEEKTLAREEEKSKET